MKEYHKNPRKISQQQIDQLRENMKEFGDISGIVHDLNTDEVISGNQRSKVVDINKCDIVITHKNDAPDEQGTVAWGHVIWDGQRFNYRQVRWTDEQREKANITANALGGNWDWKILKDSFEKVDLLNWGIDSNSKWNVFETKNKNEIEKRPKGSIILNPSFYKTIIARIEDNKGPIIILKNGDIMEIID